MNKRAESLQSKLLRGALLGIVKDNDYAQNPLHALALSAVDYWSIPIVKPDTLRGADAAMDRYSVDLYYHERMCQYHRQEAVAASQQQNMAASAAAEKCYEEASRQYWTTYAAKGLVCPKPGQAMEMFVTGFLNLHPDGPTRWEVATWLLHAFLASVGCDDSLRIARGDRS